MEIQFSSKQLKRWRVKRITTAIAIGAFAECSYLAINMAGSISLAYWSTIPYLIALMTIATCIYRYLALELEKTVTLDDMRLTITRVSRTQRLIERYPLNSLYQHKFVKSGIHQILRCCFVENKYVFLTASDDEDVAQLERLAATLERIELCDPPIYPVPVSCFLLLAAMSILYVVGDFSNPVTGFSAMLGAGGWVPQLIIQGEWFRVVSYAFLHGSLLHLLANLFGLWLLGMALEPYLGHVRFIFFFLATAAFSSLCLFWSDYAVTVGASGVLFALAGVYVTLKLTRASGFQDRFPQVTAQIIVFAVAMDTAFSLLITNVVTLLHISGFAGGVMLTLLWLKAQRVFNIALSLMLLLVLASAIASGPWDSTREHDLSLNWAASSDPVLSKVGLWQLAINPLTSRDTALAAIEQLQTTSVPHERDTYATFLARLGRYDEAITIENELLNDRTELATIYASQVTRFTLARNRSLSIMERPQNSQAIYINAICAIGNQVYFYRTSRSMPATGNCPNKPLVIGYYPGSATSYHHLELNNQILSLPLDIRQ